ncbi:nucleotidyltransferase [Fuchsiella alkaliacetigena]|uniref:nucleotidyltransferase n=1 Tax=Fuchsiella alkaliacetigena TaxID=957042 RepID=UPI00200B0A7A|nr:nucleotidyltransferase [Fuchsiella alkaliacetigena]MCK8823963.1 nucleotidyltransferase [Fuchsiella alkaliacetigena]
MKILGIITEYNPFHNGHLYHLNKALQLTKADYVICIMSGNFVQRGEPAFLNKWDRTKMALKAGVDLVIELPSSYTLRSAEYFAYGGVQLLNKTGVVDQLVFGSELGKTAPLFKIAEFLATEPPLLSKLIKKELSKGISFPQARAKALSTYFKQNNIDLKVEKIINNPNNILGIEYIKALINTKSNIEALAIKRKQAKYHQESIESKIASATAIRKRILNSSNLDFLNQVVPPASKTIISKAHSANKNPITLENFQLPILTLLRQLSAKELEQIEDVSEGLANRIIKAAEQASCLSTLIKSIKTKRFTRTRIQRILTHLLLGLKKTELAEFDQNQGPQYLRVLGFLKSSQKLLKLLKKNSQLPLITNVAQYYKSNHSPNSVLEKMLAKDIQATNIYSLAYNNAKYRQSGQDYRAPIILKNPKKQ